MFHILALFLQIQAIVIKIIETNISAAIILPITPPTILTDVPFILLFWFLLVGLVFITEEEESVEPVWVSIKDIRILLSDIVSVSECIEATKLIRKWKYN